MRKLSNPKRSWPAITVDILETTVRPTNKMRIMYRANLNFDRFSRYFGDFLRKGFIEEVNNGDGRRLYRITERGSYLLDVLKTAQELALGKEVAAQKIEVKYPV